MVTTVEDEIFRGNYGQLHELLSDVNWVGELADADVNKSVEKFYGILSPL